MSVPRFVRTASLAIVGSGLLTACVSVSDLPAPEDLETPEVYKTSVGASSMPLVERWWLAFEDETLNGLIEQAERDSPSLQQALLRVEGAVVTAGLEGSELFPQLDFLGSAIRSRQSGTTGTSVSPGTTRNRFFASLQLDWELDPWGRIRKLQHAAEQDARAANQAYGYALTLLRSQIAQTYFALRGADRRIGILEATIEVRAEALNLVGIRQRSGLSDELELAQARTEAASARADLERAHGERSALENALARLSGAMPSRFQIERRTDYQAPVPASPRAIASELLQRRPDVAEALELIQAASERIGAEVAAFYPSISLTGEYGYASRSTNGWFEEPSHLWSLGPSINLPIFQGKERQRRLELAEIEYRRLFAAYHSQVLRAFEEVETSLSTLQHLDRESTAVREASEAASRAGALARQRYESGLVSYLEVVDTERAALTAALRFSQIEMERLARLAQLCAELGGGWTSDDRS